MIIDSSLSLFRTAFTKCSYDSLPFLSFNFSFIYCQKTILYQHMYSKMEQQIHTLSNANSPGSFPPLRTSQTTEALLRKLSCEKDFDFPSASSNSILPTKVTLQLLRVPSASASLKVPTLSCFLELNLNGPIHVIF